MINLKLKRGIHLTLLTIVLGLVAAPSIGAQTTDKPQNPWAGKYEGTGKGPNGDVQMSLDLMEDAGKFSGQITTPSANYNIVKGQMANGLLSLDLSGQGSTAKLSLRQKEDKLVGELTVGGKAGPVEFKKAAIDELSGVWEAVADAQGQPFPFTLT